MTELSRTQTQKYLPKLFKDLPCMKSKRKTCLSKTEQKQFLGQTITAKPHLTSGEHKTVQAALDRSGSCGTDNNPSALLCEQILMRKTGTIRGVIIIHVNRCIDTVQSARS